MEMLEKQTSENRRRREFGAASDTERTAAYVNESERSGVTMKLNGQNNSVSSCVKAAIINILLGCFGGWTAIVYFLPGHEEPLYTLVFGIVILVYFFWLAYLNVVQAGRLKQSADVPNVPPKKSSRFYFVNALLDVAFAFVCIAPVITGVLNNTKTDAQFYTFNMLSHGLPFVFFLLLAWRNFNKSREHSSL